MSKTTLGQKSLGLTSRVFVGTGLVLSLSQSLDEEGMAGKSLAELRQQAWTQEVFAGDLLELRGTKDDILQFASLDSDFVTGSIKTKLEPASSSANQDLAYIYVTDISNTAPGAASRRPEKARTIAEVESGLEVNHVTKSDRRVGWGWEPYKVAHGRKAINLNWSGALWSLDGPFSPASEVALPKVVFAPSDDLKMVMADASQFLIPEVIAQAPASMMAKAETPQAPDQVTAANSAALAYAPNSLEALEEPFKAILTEQRSGEINENDRVTVLGAVEALDDALTGKERGEANSATQVASIAPIAALPRSRVPLNAKQSRQNEIAKVSQPLDILPVVTDLQAKEKQELALKEATKTAAPAKKEGLTLAKTKARRAELKLASLSGKNETKKKSRFASWFSFGNSRKAKLAKINTKGEHAWVTNNLPKASYSKKQRKCLANAIYFESRSEPIKGQIAVAQVVVNRVKNPAYPNSICGVVYQNQHKRNACQFSFACDRIADRIRSKKAWATATKLANQVIDGEVWLKSVGSSTHYHATYVRPKWARTMKRRGKIGLHIFYKTYGGGWS